MANNVETSERTVDLGSAPTFVGAYFVLSIATLVALAVLSATAPAQATNEAWGHAVIVAVLAVLLPLRVRSARRGSADALRASTIIAAVIGIANLVEAALPGTFPVWMRIDMLVVAALMAVVVVQLVRAKRP